MINSNQHHRLNNLMQPVVTYFSLIEAIEKQANKEDRRELMAYAEKARKSSLLVLPEITNILHGNAEPGPDD